jgi:hypothetical protein
VVCEFILNINFCGYIIFRILSISHSEFEFNRWEDSEKSWHKLSHIAEICFTILNLNVISISYLNISLNCNELLQSWWNFFRLFETETDIYHAHQCINRSSKFSKIINFVGVAKYYLRGTVKDLSRSENRNFDGLKRNLLSESRRALLDYVKSNAME